MGIAIVGAAAALGVNELVVLGGAGLAAALPRLGRGRWWIAAAPVVPGAEPPELALSAVAPFSRGRRQHDRLPAHQGR